MMRFNFVLRSEERNDVSHDNDPNIRLPFLSMKYKSRGVGGGKEERVCGALI